MQKFAYKNLGGGMTECVVEVISRDEKKAVIFHEIPGNAGMSVDDTIEDLIDSFLKVHDLQDSFTVCNRRVFERFKLYPEGAILNEVYLKTLGGIVRESRKPEYLIEFLNLNK